MSMLTSDMKDHLDEVAFPELTETELDSIYIAVRNLVETIHRCNAAVGWWDEPRNYGELMALIHSEISESLEGDRKSLMDNHLPQYENRVVELIDALIRICDTLGALESGMEVDTAQVAVDKLLFNLSRPDHKRENRAKPDGKKY